MKRLWEKHQFEFYVIDKIASPTLIVILTPFTFAMFVTPTMHFCMDLIIV